MDQLDTSVLYFALTLLSLSYYVSENFLTTPDYITTHAEVLCGPVLSPALLPLTRSPGGVLLVHQGVGVTDKECWVFNGYYSGTTLSY